MVFNTNNADPQISEPGGRRAAPARRAMTMVEILISASLTAVLTLAGSRDTVGQGIGLLVVYSAGLAIPFLIAGWSIHSFYRAFARIRKYFRALEIGSGVILIAVGALLATNQLGWIAGQFAFLAEVVVYAEELLQ